MHTFSMQMVPRRALSTAASAALLSGGTQYIKVLFSRVHVTNQADRLALHRVLMAADAELGQHGAAAGAEDGADVGDEREVAEGAWELLGV